MTGFIVNRPLQPGDRLQTRQAMLEGEVERAHDRAASEPPRRGRPCPMGVGCDEAGVCYAEAHGKPEECPNHEP